MKYIYDLIESVAQGNDVIVEYELSRSEGIRFFVGINAEGFPIIQMDNTDIEEWPYPACPPTFSTPEQFYNEQACNENYIYFYRNPERTEEQDEAEKNLEGKKLKELVATKGEYRGISHESYDEFYDKNKTDTHTNQQEKCGKCKCYHPINDLKPLLHILLKCSKEEQQREAYEALNEIINNSDNPKLAILKGKNLIPKKLESSKLKMVASPSNKKYDYRQTYRLLLDTFRIGLCSSDITERSKITDEISGYTPTKDEISDLLGEKYIPNVNHKNKKRAK